MNHTPKHLSTPLTTNHTELAFLLDDRRAGNPLTPETVDLPTLSAFLDEVETLIKGNEANPVLTDSRVRIEDGSLKVVVALGLVLARSVQADFETLATTDNLDAIQPKRAEIVEKWQKRTVGNVDRAYRFRGSAGTECTFKIAADSPFSHRSEAEWVHVEKYLTGKVVDVGGKQRPNVHLVLDSGESIRVGASESQLGNEKENHVYRERTLRVSGEQNLRTGALRELQLIEFIQMTSQIDEDGLARLWTRGKSAWSGVRDATAFVEELRGN